ncbi:MAG: thioredoxin domain-containing protein [Candidatus Firestonebacteria bacterium]
MPNLTVTDDSKFQEDVLNSPLPVLAVFKSEWCPSCKRITPVIEKLSDEYIGRVKFVNVDAIKNVKAAAENSVLAIPTLLIFKAGKELERQTGYLPEADLKALIDKNL